ncbi:MAG: hypothetical protein ACXVDD_13665 [Polyangia bacterium]
MNAASLAEIARQVLSPVEAPASYVHSQLLSPEEPESDDVDEWLTLDVDVARRLAEANERVVLRWPALTLHEAPRLQFLSFEAIVRGVNAAELDDSLRALGVALARGASVRAALAFGDTGIDCYRAAAATRRNLGTAIPIRARWDGPLDVKGAALALTFGADEIAGPMAPPKQRYKLAQLGGPPEDGGRPSPAFVESLIQAAGRFPARRK